MNKKIGSPESFDLKEEYPETSWGKRFRDCRLVFRKYFGEFEFHSYNGDHRPKAFIDQIIRSDIYFNFDDFDYIRLYTSDNNPLSSLVEVSKEPVFSQCQIDESSYCCKDFKLKQFHPDLKICPDFQFSNWLDFNYESYIEELKEASLKNPKINKVCWRGLARPHHSNRKLLCKMSTQFPNLIDAKDTGKNKNNLDYIPMKEMVSNYKYLIDTQAYGFSGRLKYLMHSNRLIFMQDRFYKTFIEEDLVPWVHYVPVKYDFSDLVEKIQWAEGNEEEANKIKEQMFSFALKNLSVHAINKKWQQLLTGKL